MGALKKIKSAHILFFDFYSGEKLVIQRLYIEI
jgi:hypothetical protein